MYPTIEDIYSAMIETDRGVKEKVIIYDTGSLVSNGNILFNNMFVFLGVISRPIDSNIVVYV